jgi:hypothetical protein
MIQYVVGHVSGKFAKFGFCITQPKQMSERWKIHEGEMGHVLIRLQYKERTIRLFVHGAKHKCQCQSI